MENKFTLHGVDYQLSKIGAMKQFHIVRRIGPILSELISASKDIQKLSKDANSLSEAEKLEEFSKFAAPLMVGISKLSDDDSNKVLNGLLEAVEMKQAEFGSWVKVSNGSTLNVQTMELPTMLQLAGRAFMFNLSGFFAALPQK